MKNDRTECQENGIREKVRRFINAPASSVQPFFIPASVVVKAGAKDPMIEMIEARR